jgi:hypothetical protein
MARKHQAGFLTVYSLDGGQIYGEFADAVWDEDEAGGDVNNIFSGLASEGTYETFRKLNLDGIEHVTFRFEADGQAFSGEGRLLALERADPPAAAKVLVESLHDLEPTGTALKS